MPDNNAADVSAEQIKKIQEAIQASSRTGQVGLESLEIGFKKLKDAVKDTDNQMQALSIASLTFFGNNNQAFRIFENSLSSGIAGLETYKERYNQVSSYIQNISDATAKSLKDAFNIKTEGKGQGEIIQVKKFLQNMLEDGLNQKKLQESIMQSAAATGQMYKLPDVYKDGKVDLEALNKLTVDYTAKLDDLMTSTGLNTEEAAKYFKLLQDIPGGLKMVSEGADISSKKTSQFGVDLVNLSRATHIPVETFTTQIKNLRDNFNVFTDEGAGGPKVLKFLASLSEASNKLGVDFATLKDTVNNIGMSFKYYGDVSDQSVNEAYKMSKALEATGLSAKSSLEVTQNFTNQISKLTMAQKAFVSQSTGGPGGLRGAFEIESLIKEGKFSEVVDKVKQTIKERIGPIVSLEEARGSEEASAERYKQMQLTRNLLGPMAADDASAERLIDAFAKEDTGQVVDATLKDSGTIFKNMMENSKKEQEENKNIFGDLQAAADSTKLSAQVTAYNTTQLVLFAKKRGEGIGEETSILQAAGSFQQKISEAFKSKTGESHVTGVAGKTVKSGESYQKEVLDKNKGAAEAAASGIKGLFDYVSYGFKMPSKEDVQNRIKSTQDQILELNKNPSANKSKEEEDKLSKLNEELKELQKKITEMGGVAPIAANTAIEKKIKKVPPPPKPAVPPKAEAEKPVITRTAATPTTSTTAEDKKVVDVPFEIKGHALCDGCMQPIIEFVTKHSGRTHAYNKASE